MRDEDTAPGLKADYPLTVLAIVFERGELSPEGGTLTEGRPALLEELEALQVDPADPVGPGAPPSTKLLGWPGGSTL